MSDPWNDLLHCLTLESSDQPLHFQGRNQQLDYHRVFGGQLLGQAIEAARTVFPDQSDGRCFGRGDLLTTSGALVASYAQEALLRIAN